MAYCPMTKMRIIESPKNERIKELKRLRDQKHTGSEDAFFIEGLRFVTEAHRQGATFMTLLIPMEGELPFDVSEDTEVLAVSPDVFKSLSGTVQPQPYMALVQRKQQTFPEEGLFFYLDEVRDPGNLGTIIRSAHAFNIAGLYLSKGCVDPFSDKVLRSTMGSIFKVPLMLNASLETLEKKQEEGFQLYLTNLHEAKSAKDTKNNQKAIVVLGNEAHGVSSAIQALSHENILIPMPGQAESLNVAVAASILMYEFNAR